MKKKFSLINLVSLIFTLVGCSETYYEPPEFVFVTFKNYDDSVLYHTKIPYGTVVTFEGEEPSREKSSDKIYTFSGWDKNINEPLYDNTIFNATYSESVRNYVVTFYNYDQTELWRCNVAYGSYAKYNSTIPSKKSDDEHIEYEFDGWDKDINTYKITGDTKFIAQYKTNEYVFATFNNYDNSFLSRQKIKKGSSVVYNGFFPTRAYSGEDKVYRFKGRDKNLNNITSDTVFTAQFNLLNLYNVTFKNYNDVILQESKVAEGDTAIYSGSKPNRSSTTSGDYITSYEFNGRDKSLNNIRSNTIFYATYKSTIKVTGQTAIKQHLNNYGSGTYHNVTTSDGTTLGYLDNYYYVGFVSNSDNVETIVAAHFSYGATSGYSTFQMTVNGVTTFKATYIAHVSNHLLSQLELSNLQICVYTDQERLKALADLSYNGTAIAITAASIYLKNNSLPYIW